MATEKRLIDANAYKASLTKWKEDAWKHNERHDAMLIADCLSELELMSTVDAVEAVHGHWCWEGKFKACSECGSYVEWDETLGANFWKFCPYCGAKMDGGTENGNN